MKKTAYSLLLGAVMLAIPLAEEDAVSAFRDKRMTIEDALAVKQIGADLSKHRSRPLSVELIHQADIIFAMGRSHLQAVLSLVQEAMWITFLVSAPLLLVTLVVGLVIAVLQAATQINEMTLSFIPKLVALFATLVVAGPWMLSILADYTQRLFERIPQLGA